MSKSARTRVGGVTALQFAVAVAIVLWPVQGWAQSSISVEFSPTKEQKLDARPAPAQKTTEDESALTSKGYLEIGTIGAWHPGGKADPDITRQLESAILQKAAEAGGDVVYFNEKGEVVKFDEPTGKTKTKRYCDNRVTTRTAYGQYETCLKWGDPEYIPVTKRVTRLASGGTVWRYDPELAAEVARKNMAARHAARITLEETEKAQEASRNPQAFKAAEATEKNFGPLHDALEFERNDEAESLAQSADANARDALGRTHLHYAAMYGNTKVAELLLAHGADVNVKDNSGETPLIVAMGWGTKAMVELLLAHGADVNSRNAATFTPLHLAAMEGRKDLAELLLAHGADVNAKAGKGITPLKMAVLGAHQDVADLLRQHGGHK